MVKLEDKWLQILLFRWEPGTQNHTLETSRCNQNTDRPLPLASIFSITQSQRTSNSDQILQEWWLQWWQWWSGKQRLWFRYSLRWLCHFLLFVMWRIYGWQRGYEVGLKELRVQARRMVGWAVLRVKGCNDGIKKSRKKTRLLYMLTCCPNTNFVFRASIDPRHGLETCTSWIQLREK